MIARRGQQLSMPKRSPLASDPPVMIPTRSASEGNLNTLADASGQYTQRALNQIKESKMASRILNGESTSSR